MRALHQILNTLIAIYIKNGVFLSQNTLFCRLQVFCLYGNAIHSLCQACVGAKWTLLIGAAACSHLFIRFCLAKKY